MFLGLELIVADINFCLAGLVIILTVPAFYERYEDHIDKYAMSLCKELRQLYIKLDAECFSKIRKWILEKRKLNWYFLFWLVWWIKKVIGFGYFCLWWIHFCLFGFLFLSSHSLKVLDKGCNSWKWVFSSICDKCIRYGIFFFTILNGMRMFRYCIEFFQFDIEDGLI